MFLLISTMASLLLGSAVVRRAAAFPPRHSAFILGWDGLATRKRDSSTLLLRPTQTKHHFATLTLQHAHTSDDEQQQSTTTTQKKSRKQRRRISKEINLTRIDKLLAHRGVGTRSQTFDLAKAKRITVADRPDAPHEERTRICGPKEKVPFNASLFLDGKLLPGPPPLLLVYHKPKYVLSVMEDDKKYADQQRKHLGQVLEPRYKMAGLHPVGRLDYDSTGLILFSLDGKLTQRLLHPKRGGVEKEYICTVQGAANAEELSKKLSDGVTTTEGVHTAVLIAVTPSNYNGSNVMMDADDDELPTIDELDNMLLDDEDMDEDIEILEEYDGPYSDVTLTVKEGKYRMVRRMLANCGLPVVELKRLRHGKVELGDLPVGEFRQATTAEIEWAESLIN